MYSKAYRLKKDEIELVARKGKRYTSEKFDIRVLSDDSKTIPQFSIAVSKKIDKRSFIRNTIKRKFRAAIYELLKENFFKNGSYLFIIKSVNIADLSSNELRSLLKNTL